ncbi:uncharacterized protein LOC126659550 [Mercurialis annua]|uniref:uncharacterized protein LOC126659550 n=1 Tax=Mercurialis annua TaxID=3986 RepID=UPI0021608E41|nr:uncharacterized protein LOC126659550 [Mercurialis annua]
MAPTIFQVNPLNTSLFINNFFACNYDYQLSFIFLLLLLAARTIMKFEDYLMQQSDHEKQKRLDLQEEVGKLKGKLKDEEAINKVLHSALHGPVSAHPCLTSLLPPQVQCLLSELSTVEDEIIWLERKVDELKLSLYHERKQTEKWKPQKKHHRKLRHLPPIKPENPSGSGAFDDDLNRQLSRSQHHNHSRKEKMKLRRASFGSADELWGLISTNSTHEEKSRRRRMRKEPNELSEELIKCLISIYLDLNQLPQSNKQESAVVPKLSLSCMNSKGSKNSFNCKASMFQFNDNMSNIDPYGIMPDFDSTTRDIGPYKDFIQITRNSIDFSRFSEQTGKLRALMHTLGKVDLTILTYKQKLAFWINIYNACIMHAFLEHGLPSSHDELLAIMNKGVLNVGGIVLNALAIEHFILRYPCETKQGPPDEKEMLLRNAYGLGYPEPNVTFALCRGTWSSPALRVYTPEEVVNELEKAKVEYLEASVGITSKKKIVIPKILKWHMKDFADDMDSLLEWIYSQLPRSGSLKRLMMECLMGETKSISTKIEQIQPYGSQFRYLLPL